MASIFAAQAELCRLRRDIARLEGRLVEAGGIAPQSDRAGEVSTLASTRVAPGAPPLPSGLAGPQREPYLTGSYLAGPANPPRFGSRRRPKRLRLGVAALDERIGGGLSLATLHEIRACESRDGGAAAGFALALLASLMRASGPSSLVWISEAGSRREAGSLYGPGLLAFGLDPSRIVEVAARTQAEALWSFEAALACRDVGAVVCEMRRVSLNLTATRRCVLRAREAGVTGFLLRMGVEAEPTAAELRFRLAPAPAGAIGPAMGNFLGDRRSGVGRMAWRLTLEKNRAGRTGIFTLEWNAHERRFAERTGGAERARGEEGEAGRRAHPQHFPAAPAYRPPAAAGAEMADRIDVGPEPKQLRRAS